MPLIVKTKRGFKLVPSMMDELVRAFHLACDSHLSPSQEVRVSEFFNRLHPRKGCE